MTTKRKKRRRNSSIGRKSIRRTTLHNLFVLGFALVCAALLFFGSQGILRSYVKKHDDGKILSGIYVGNTDVSGMERSEAIEVVKKEVSACGAETVMIEIAQGENIEATLQELGLSSSDVEDVVEQAMKYGRSGSSVLRYKAIKKSEKKNWNSISHWSIRWRGKLRLKS